MPKHTMQQSNVKREIYSYKHLYLKTSKITNLTFHLKELKKEQIKLKARRTKIIKVRDK